MRHNSKTTLSKISIGEADSKKNQYLLQLKLQRVNFG